MPRPDETHFLDVDLDLRGRREGLAPLVRALGPAVVVLALEDDFASVELAEPPESVEAAVEAFGRLVRALPGPTRALWDGCAARRLNVGLEAGRTPHAAHFVLGREALAQVEALGAELELTVYGAAAPA